MKSLFRHSGLKVGPKSLQKLKKPITWLMVGLIMFVMTGLINITQVWAAVPPIPQNVTAEGISDSEIKVSWSDVSGETGYRVFRSKYSSTNFTQVGEVGLNITSYTDTNLAECDYYYYKVKSFNVDGESALSDPSPKTYTKPIAPTELTAIGLIDSVGLYWKDNSQKESGYSIEQSTEPNSGFSQVATTSVNATTKEITGLTAGTTYYFKVKALYFSFNESDYSSTASAKALKAPEWVGKTPVLGNSYKVKLYGGRAYVASSFGLQIVNLSDPDYPRVEGSIEFSNSDDVAVTQNFAYVGNGTQISVVSLANLQHPEVVGTPIDMPGTGRGLFISGNRLYAACYTAGLAVVDIANPSAPSLRGVVDTPGQAFGVSASGTLAVVADGTAGVQVVDAANASSPSIVGSVATSDITRGVAISGDYAYVAASTAGLLSVDISKPNAPEIKGTVNVPQYGSAASGVALSGSYVFVAIAGQGYGNGLQVVDISKPAPPVQLSFLIIEGEIRGGVAVESGLAYVTTGSFGVAVVDVQNPASPSLKSQVHAVRFSQSVISDGSLLLATNQNGLLIFDVHNGAAPVHLSSISFSNPSYAVALGLGYAYVGNGAQISVVSLANLQHPEVVATLTETDGMPPGYAQHLFISGNTLYAACYTSGLAVVDIANPSAPSLLGVLDTPGQALGVSASGTLAVVADGTAGVQVVNAANASSPSIVGSVATSGTARGVAVSGDYAYVAADKAGLVSVDISKPSAPEIKGTVNVPQYGSATGVAVSGSYAFVSYVGYSLGSNGLQVINISDPTHIREISSLEKPSPTTSRAVAVAKGYAYLADDSRLVLIADVSDFMPTELTVEKSADKTTTASGEEITYTLNVKNETASTMTNVILRDPLPVGTSFVSAENDGTLSGGIVIWPAVSSFASGDSFMRKFKVRAE